MATTKKINRKELEHDEFVERVFDLGDWLEAHWREAAMAAGAVVLAVLAFIGLGAWRGRSLSRANEALGQGLEAFEPQRRADGTTAPSRPQEALASFESAEKLGGSRGVGRVASYYRALTLMELGRHAEAIPLLEKLASSGTDFASQAKVSLSNALAAKGDYDRAATLLQEVSSDPGAVFPPDAALAMLGALRARQGRTDEARKAYEDLLQRFPQSGSAAEARQRLSELGGPTLPASSSATTR